MKIVVKKVDVRLAKRDKEGYADACREYVRLHFWFEKETVMDHLWNRHCEPYEEVRPLLAEALASHGVTFEKSQWSQKCGCSCGCSPGFRLRGVKVNGVPRHELPLYERPVTVFLDLAIVAEESEVCGVAGETQGDSGGDLGQDRADD